MKTELCVGMWVDLVFAMAVPSAKNSDIFSYKCLGMLRNATNNIVMERIAVQSQVCILFCAARRRKTDSDQQKNNSTKFSVSLPKQPSY